MIAQTECDLTGYPSNNKSWLKYYDKALMEEEIPECSAFRMLYENNKDYMKKKGSERYFVMQWQ